MKNRNLDHSDNWATPKDLYNKLNDEFKFDFDPCPWNDGDVTPENDGLIIDMLNSWLIDWRGLIDKGLAVEITEL